MEFITRKGADRIGLSSLCQILSVSWCLVFISINARIHMWNAL